MKNRDLIIKTARRLDKFNLDELIVVSELDEKEVTEILSDLVKQQIILKNNNTYFFNTKKSAEITNNDGDETISEFKPIVIEEEEGYEDFLKFNEETQNRVRAHVGLLNLIHQAGTKNINKVVELFNETSGYPRIAPSTFTRIRRKYSQYGFRGILPKFSKHITVAIPGEIYTCFKKYYLTNEKLSAQEAIYRAQKELQAEQKIEQPYAYDSKPFVRKVRTEFTKEQIEYFRNNIEAPKTKIETIKIKEPLDMTFEKAAYVYMKHLKMENKLEQLMHDKTSYKNHLKPYFDNLTIREITTKVVAQFKQSMFDNGFQLVSVNIYISLLKKIIRTVCPQTNSLVTRGSTRKNVYYVDMNILSDKEIVDLLYLCYKKYPLAYPVIYLTLSTGAGIPEILALTWDKVNFEDKTISLKYFLYEQRLVMNRSSSSIRTLKFDNRISDILKKKFKKTKPELTDFVFKFDSPKFPQQYIENVVLRGLSAHLGIVKLHPSDLQHNFVNMCLKQNVPITFIQKALGYFGLGNFVKLYKDLIESLENGNYNPLDKIYTEAKLEYKIK